ncbi:MAG: flagellar filament capping protein FliD [Holophaga sp.]|jgi:flagellar hook-associated protein 2
MSSAINFSNLNTSGNTSSFAGITSGINTTALVQAEVAQASLPLQQLQAQQTANNNESSALTNLQTQMQALASALSDLNTIGLTARTVTSSDSTNSYVTATASGGASGTYSLQVQQVATNAQLSPSLDSSGNPTNLAVASATAPVFTDTSGNGTGTATFAIEGTDGVTKQITLSGGQNNIYALAAAINAATVPDPTVPGSVGLGVNATVVNTGSGPDPYELVLTSAQTGVGSAGSNLTIADVTAGGAVNTLGIAAGTLSSDGSSIASGGTQSNQAAQDAQFSLDGIKLTRASNNVSDAVQGVTFNLVQGNQTGTTTLTVAPDASTASTSMQSMISAYNSLMNAYNTDIAGSGPLSGNTGAMALIQQIQATLTGPVHGLAASSIYNSASSLGVSTNSNGTLSLDTTKFTAAFQADPTAATNVFATSSSSTNAVVSLGVAGPNTASGVFGFNITSYTAGGAVAGTITAPDGTQYNLTGTNGVLMGTQGTPLDGLYLDVSGTGTGSLNLAQGAGQAAQNVITNLTDPVTGTITQLLNQITTSNQDLASQITVQQNYLNTLQTNLQNQYSQMESTLAQLQAASQSITTLG